MSKTKHRKLTQAMVDVIQIDEVIKDTDLPGFQVRGRKSGPVFYLYYRTRRGVQRKPKIGTAAEMSITRARKIARQWLDEVKAGGDPLGSFQETKAKATMAVLADRYLKEYAYPRKKTAQEDERTINHWVLKSLGKTTLVEDVTTDDIETLRKAMAKSPVRFNRVLALMSKMFNLAERWGYRPQNTNPCKHVERNPEVARERVLDAIEFDRLWRSLDYFKDTNFMAVCLFRLMIITGARKGEWLKAKWSWLEDNVLVLPDNKTGRKNKPVKKRIHLPEPAMKVIEELRTFSGRHASGYMFPNRNRNPKTPYMTSPANFWTKLRSFAEIPDVRPHDLRHCFVSMGLAQGYSLEQVGKLVGHKSTQTTARYAHLLKDQTTDMVARIGEGFMQPTSADKAPANSDVDYKALFEDSQRKLDQLLAAIGQAKA